MAGAVSDEQLALLKQKNRVPQNASLDYIESLEWNRKIVSASFRDPIIETRFTGLGTAQFSAAVVRLETVPWTIIVAQPQDVFLEPVVAQMQSAFLLVSIIILVVSYLTFSLVLPPFLYAFFGLFVITLFLGGLVSSLMSKLIDKTGLSGTDRAAGMLFGIVRRKKEVVSMRLAVTTGVKVIKNVAYLQGGRDEKLDLYLPAAIANTFFILFFLQWRCILFLLGLNA